MPTPSKRPFRILGVQQIAMGHESRQKLHQLWVDLLGVEVVGQFRSESENVDEEILRIGEGSRRVEIDLMQPIDPNRAPKVHIPPLNHIGLWVDNLDAAHSWLEAQGLRFTPQGIREGAGGHRVCFIHPKGNEEHPLCGEGVLIELVEAPADIARPDDGDEAGTKR